MTEVWYVDDSKLSHVNSFEITKFAGYLPIIYGGITVNRGEVHDYLGINLYYSEQVKVQVFNIIYLDSVIQ